MIPTFLSRIFPRVISLRRVAMSDTPEHLGTRIWECEKMQLDAVTRNETDISNGMRKYTWKCVVRSSVSKDWKSNRNNWKRHIFLEKRRKLYFPVLMETLIRRENS